MEFVLSRVHPDDRAAFDRELERARDGAERFDFEHRCVMPDGSIRHLHAVAQAHVDDAGEVEYLGAACRPDRGQGGGDGPCSRHMRSLPT